MVVVGAAAAMALTAAPASATPHDRHEAQAATAPGWVQGKVLTASGKPRPGVLVQTIGYRDLQNRDQAEPAQGGTFTDSRGAYRLRQPRGRYLVKVCRPAPSRGGGHRTTSEPEKVCASENDITYVRTYLGPDGASDSWLLQTRFFSPGATTRRLPAIRPATAATIAGTIRGLGDGSVRLLRLDGSLVSNVPAEDGRFSFRTAAGRYRVEVPFHQGLRGPSIVPGYRSGVVSLKAGRTTRLTGALRHAGTVRGQVTHDGRPVADEHLVLTDATGRKPIGSVTTDAHGRYVIAALRAGSYRIGTTHRSSSLVPRSRRFWLGSTSASTVADLDLATGATVGFVPRFTAPPVGELEVELVDAQGRVVEGHKDEDLASADGRPVTISGVPDGSYTLRLRVGELYETNASHPWAVQKVTVSGGQDVDLGEVAVDRADVDLRGVTAPGASVRILAKPADADFETAVVRGSESTPVAFSWTTRADSRGRFVVRGVLPGRYLARVSAAFLDGGEAHAGNVVATWHWIEIGEQGAVVTLRAAKGASVSARLLYAKNRRPVIADVGLELRSSAPVPAMLPLYSRASRYGGVSFVDRIPTGRASARLLDVEHLGDVLESGALVPADLRSGKGTHEDQTAHFLTATPITRAFVAGRHVRLGDVLVRVRE
jgi:hypothetical protein